MGYCIEKVILLVFIFGICFCMDHFNVCLDNKEEFDVRGTEFALAKKLIITSHRTYYYKFTLVR